MNNNLALLNLLERVLGKGIRGNKNNYKFVCPFHQSNPPGKKKLEINIETQQYHCWSCPTTNNSKGNTILQLFKKMNINSNLIQELNSIVPPKSSSNKRKNVLNNINAPLELPIEFNPFYGFKFDDSKNSIKNISAKKAINYLKSRNISKEDIIKYNIGFCYEGHYENRIIIPSYDELGNLNYFTARDYTDNSYYKYDNPKISLRNIIAFENFINWNVPIVLTEGVFDAICFKRNCIPLFGKVIHDKLISKILQSKSKKVYLALDRDALRDSIQQCEKLIKHGVEVYLVELTEKDVSSMGFEKFLDIIEQTTKLTFEKLLYKKLELI